MNSTVRRVPQPDDLQNRCGDSRLLKGAVAAVTQARHLNRNNVRRVCGPFPLGADRTGYGSVIQRRSWCAGGQRRWFDLLLSPSALC